MSPVPDGKYGSLKPYGRTGMERQLKEDVVVVVAAAAVVVAAVVIVVAVVVVVVLVNMELPRRCILAFRQEVRVTQVLRVDRHGAAVQRGYLTYCVMF